MSVPPGERLGARPLEGGAARFCLWAPNVVTPALRLEGRPDVALDDLGHGYFAATVADCGPGARYRYVRDDGTTLADPASRSQPEGVHGPSEVVDLTSYAWGDTNYRARPLWDHVTYELHLGTFTEGGTFESALAELDALVELGVSAVEVMPVAQFPGARNWGYDGVFAFAVQNSYGGPLGLQRFVDVCHQKGLAVILDVVYNHLGPEGNVLGGFAPYFNDHYQTPWGPALNFDGAGSDNVRDYYWSNARQWFEDFHVDALRLDAVHAIVDASAFPFIAQLSRRCAQLSDELARPCVLIAESAANDPRTVAPVRDGGLGMDAQWNDDFHHALHVALTGERAGYYGDYDGVGDLAIALDEGFALQGRYSAFRDHRHGASSLGIAPDQLVVFAQNHDQIGNRARGDRLSTMIEPAQARLAAAIVLLGPNLPLLFMGEEYGETAPFPYFIDHGDEQLIQSVREGRAREFKDFADQGELLDPQSADTFVAARLNHALRASGDHRSLWELYRRLIALRRSLPALRRSPLRQNARAWAEDKVITLVRTHQEGDVTVLFNLSPSGARARLAPHYPWRDVLNESDELVSDVDLEAWGFALFTSVGS